MQDITFFAKTNFRNQNVKFGIKSEDRQRHIYVVGKTGMGKTTLLENIVMQDIVNGHGVAYIDPHGDTAEKLIQAIPSNRINDVVYFNPSDMENPIAFNILEAVKEDKKHLVASGMMGVFKKIWPDVWSARMEYILNNAILALLDYPGSTMMGVNRMMSDKKYRQRVYEKIKDPVVKGFWLDEFETWEDRFRKEAVAAIQNKVGQFLSSSLIRNIIGQTKSTINMREIMDNNKILIVNLSKGKIGEDAMRLLGGMIVTKIQLAAMERVNIPEEERKNFYLTVDEFQNFVTESFANILSEARKYRLNLLVAHQYINQLVFDGNSTVRDAMFGNIGTLITFRVGAEDAEFLEKEFQPIFMMNDIINLPKYNIYLKLMIDGIAGDAFSATALPPIDLLKTKANEEKVIKISRERYSNNRQDVEDKIARWTGMITQKNVISNPKTKKDYTTKQNIDNAENRNNANNTNLNRYNDNSEVMNTKSVSGITKGKKQSDYKLNFIENKPVESGQNLLQKKASEKNKKEEIKAEVRKNISKSKKYKTICDTCGVEIEIPFKPDGERPTFCRDCLRDYQRALARLKNKESEIKKNRVDSTQRKGTLFDKKKRSSTNPSAKKLEINTEEMVYIPKDKPLHLSQTKYMAPRKNKNLHTVQNKMKIKEILNKVKNNEG